MVPLLYTRVTSTFGLLYVDVPLWPRAYSCTAASARSGAALGRTFDAIVKDYDMISKIRARLPVRNHLSYNPISGLYGIRRSM